MRVLFISAVLPYPLYSGGQVRIYNLLKQLSGKHRITLFAFIRSKSERRYLQNLQFLSDVELFYRGKRYYPKHLLRSLGGTPLLLASYHDETLRRRIGAFVLEGRTDLIHIEPFYVSASLPQHLPPLVVAEHNVEYQVYRDFATKFPVAWLRPLLHHEATGIGVWETKTLRRAGRITAVSEEDGTAFSRLAPKIPVTVVPNGVDTHWFHFSSRRFNDGKRFRAVFVGNFNWIANRGAAEYLVRTVWPPIAARYPQAELTVVGRDIPVSLSTMADRQVTFRGNVADIRGIFDTADVLLAPMEISGGSKFKILEAMASGVPVITTAAGAAGLPVVDGKHLTIAETPEQFMQSLVTLVSDQKKRIQMIRKARKLTERNFDWSVIARTLSGVWEAAV